MTKQTTIVVIGRLRVNGKIRVSFSRAVLCQVVMLLISGLYMYHLLLMSG